ncbi:MAG TPA: glycosyltransferase family 4 protein [Mucilaginibacter sp.]|jgi:glycosyltransferase involved in cell wall biosynthesis|nr:glycosyltransferase family 4 protein [Mucilaginibacter sp.]
MRLAIIITHPIQYYAPGFKLLHERGNITIKVFYTWGEKALNKYDPGFDKNITWDIPLLDGYPYEWVENTSVDPGTHHFKGIVNPDLINQLKAWQPDALLIYGWAYNSHLLAMRYFKNKIPVLFRGDSTLLNKKKGVKALLKSIFLKWVYKQIDHAFYVGTNNKAYFKKFGLEESQLSFAPHAIDNDRFAFDKTEEAILIRQKLGIQNSEILILFAGKLEDKKSPLLLLDAFLALKSTGSHLLFLGNGALETVLKNKSANLTNVHFMDFQNQSMMPTMYQACDLFCLPSRGPGETWGLAVNEAMACGKAVLVSDKVGCAVDLVKENYNGAIFKSEDINDLTSKLGILITSKSNLQEYGRNSKILINDWNFSKIAEAIENKLNAAEA